MLQLSENLTQQQLYIAVSRQRDSLTGFSVSWDSKLNLIKTLTPVGKKRPMIRQAQCKLEPVFTPT